MATDHDVEPRPRRRGLFSGRPLSRAERLFLALLIGGAVGVSVLAILLQHPYHVAKDFTYPLFAARALLDGLDPYQIRYPFREPLFYPLPAAIVSVPFAPLATPAAAATFAGLSAGALAYVLLAQGVWRLWLFLSAPFLYALSVVQWTPALIVGAMVPSVGFVLAAKPTIGAALFAWRPSVGALVGGVVIVALGLLLVPSWPMEWLAATRSAPHHAPPIAQPLGWIPLLALLVWRKPEARLVAAMACVPQNLYFYDQLPLCLVAWNGASAAVLTVASWLAYALTRWRCTDPFFCGAEAEPWVLLLVYLPATALLLYRWRGEIPVVGRRLAARTSPDVLPPPEVAR